MSTATPQVSVVIPTYNQPALLATTLDSVLRQTFTDFEVVIVDDGSTQPTQDYLKSIVDPRVRVIRQPNGGIGQARNRGIDEARGHYVALLDHDDIWMPNKLEVQVDYLKSNPECVTCIVPWAYSTNPTRGVVDFGNLIDKSGFIQNPLRVLSNNQIFITTSSMMFDATRIGSLRYETRRRCIEDIPFQIGLFALGEFGVADKHGIQMVYSWHAANNSSDCEYWFSGAKFLRELETSGRFASIGKNSQSDLHRYLAQVSRTAAMHLLKSSRRNEAAWWYLQEFGRQFVIGRFKFLLGFPVYLLLNFLGVARRDKPRVV